MKLASILLTKDSPKFSTEEKESNLMLFTFSKQVKIYLLELNDNINPSLLSIEFEFYNPFQRKFISLSRFRASFLHQSGLFILDTSKIKAMVIDMEQNARFTVTAKTEDESDFSLKLYYETDQSSSQMTEVV